MQSLREKPAYRSRDIYELAGSKATAHRIIDRLVELGLAQRLNRGYFSVRSSVFQPYWVWLLLRPSLQSLKEARFFGRAYGESDVSFARRKVRGILTLDYRAFEMTKLQTPQTCYIYVDDVGTAADGLRECGFSEGKAGRVAIMPKHGHFENEVQRVYLDCLAAGGRSTLDAIAIELLFGDELTIRGEFRADAVAKVMEELRVGAR
jgi:hypothetical protein